MSLPEQYRLAESLERHLGDPADPRTPTSFARAVAADEAECYPAEACAALDAWGLPAYYVPQRWGGGLRSYEQLLSLLRVVSRRDFTVGFAYSILSVLGSAATWVGGSEHQRRKVAHLIKEGEQIILAYNEKAHGGDFLASEVRAERVEGGYLLRGEKWLIGNAVRCAALTVFARTREEGGPRGFSLFLVEKDALEAGSFHYLDRVKTLGVRGAHVSGIRFTNAFVPDTALIGAEGGALELTLRAFQITRTVIPALSLGAADTALRATTDFTLSRRLYAATAFDIPSVRRSLADAFADLLLCEAAAVTGARTLHQWPGQMRLYSAAFKYFVPERVERTVQRLARVLGARHFLREGHWNGIFQKILRDNVVVRYHFNSALNLTTVGAHLRDLVAQRRDPHAAAHATTHSAPRLAPVFDLSAPLADFDPAALSLYARGQDFILDGLAHTLELLTAESECDADPAIVAPVIRLGQRLLQAREEFDRSQRETQLRLGRAYSDSPEMFEQAGHYCLLLAAGCCLHLWAHSRAEVGGFFGEGRWVIYVLGRVLGELGIGCGEEVREQEGALVEELQRLVEEGRMLSLFPFQLAASGDGEGEAESIVEEECAHAAS